jgi:hypothetical protein
MATHVQIYLALLAFSIILFALLILNLRYDLFNSWFIAIGFFLIYLVHQKFKIKS